MVKTAKVLYDKKYDQYGHILNEELYQCSLPHLYPMTATIELIADKALKESERANLLENYELIEIDITHKNSNGNSYSSIIKKLKETAIEDLSRNEDLDKVYMISGNKPSHEAHYLKEVTSNYHVSFFLHVQGMSSPETKCHGVVSATSKEDAIEQILNIDYKNTSVSDREYIKGCLTATKI
jgi:hypothetical protein